VAVIFEIAWLVLVNAALQLPLTQTLVNGIRPDKFHVSWEKAWTWYPARVHITGAFANGQSRSQQWQLEAPSITASISLLPLILKRVWIDDVVARDVDYRQRPRLRPDRDYSDVTGYFPEIEGWDMTEAVTGPRKRRNWRIAVDDIHVSGNHQYWIHNLRGKGWGTIAADLGYDTRDRSFSLDAWQVDLQLDAPILNGDNEIFRRGSIRGSLGFSPFVPSEHKDISLLGFLIVDAELDVDMNSLAFVNLFTLDYEGVAVDGQGKVGGRLRLDRGVAVPGTALKIDAENLQVRMLDHEIQGIGRVNLTLGPETGNQLDLGFEFLDLQVKQGENTEPFMTGQRLQLNIGGDGKLLRDPGEINESRRIAFQMDRLAVSDLSSLQRYLPEKWPIELHGGNGYLRGAAWLTPTALGFDLRLDSDRAEIGFQNYRFETDLEAALKLDNPSVLTRSTRVGGSYIRLSQAQLENEGLQDEKPWGAYLEIEDGHFSLLHDSDVIGNDNVIDLFQVLAESETQELLGDSSARLRLQAEVSSLAWIGVLLGHEYNTDVSGDSTIGGQLALEAGLPAAGTLIAIRSDKLAVRFLDYLGRGSGLITFRADEGRTGEDWSLGIELSEAAMSRLDEPEPFLQDVAMSLDAVMEDMALDREERDYSLAYAVGSARVTDMSTFNSLLPADSPVQFTSGTADLTADIVLHPESAEGWLKLHSKAVQARVDDQSVTGDISANLSLSGGTPAEMKFDIRGSVFELTGLRVSGENSQFDQEDWSARIELTRGETDLGEPRRMNLEARLVMSDSRPFVAMFRNQDGWRPDFLSDMITVKDIEGTGQVLMNGERLVIPYSRAVSDHIEIGAKGEIVGDVGEGILYLRYKRAEALLEIHNGRKRVDLFRPRQKFDDYRVAPP
jgi:hypothetical protein